jgi:membrane protein
MAERLRIDPLQIEPIVDALVGLDWVGRLDEPGDGQRLVLLADPEATPGQPLVAAFLLDPSPVVRGFWRRAQLADMTLAQLLEA